MGSAMAEIKPKKSPMKKMFIATIKYSQFFNKMIFFRKNIIMSDSVKYKIDEKLPRDTFKKS